jgi:hypothetical protein
MIDRHDGAWGRELSRTRLAVGFSRVTVLTPVRWLARCAPCHRLRTDYSPWGTSQNGAPAHVRLAERHGEISGDHGTNVGGDCRNTGEGERAGVEERRRQL